MAEPIRSSYKSLQIEPFYEGSAAAAFSKDGRLLAAPNNEDIVVLDISTNTIVHTLEGDGELVTALALSPDGAALAVVSQSQQLRIFDVQSGEVTKQYKLPAPAYIAAADPTSSLFAFGGTDGVVTVWDIEGAYVTHALKGHGTTVCSLRFHGELHSDRWMLALGDTQGTAKVWDLVKRKAVATMKEHTSAVRGLAFSDDGEWFMTGGRDDVVVVYSTSNLRRPKNTFLVRHQVELCGFVPGGHFFTSGTNCRLALWKLETGEPVGGSRPPLETLEEVTVIDVAVTSQHAWLVHSDQTLVAVDLAASDVPVVRTLAGNHGIIADLRSAGAGHGLVAMATNAPALRVIDPQRPFDVQLYEGHTDLLNCLDVSEDGTWILTGSKDKEARLWHEEDGVLVVHTVFSGHAGAVTACCLPKTGRKPAFVLTASADLTVKKWAVAPGTVRTSEYTRRAHEKDINAMAIAPNDELFATASFDKMAKVWDVAAGETVGVLRGHKRGLWDVSFCQYDRLVATCSGDKTAKVWLLADYTCTKTLEGHTNAVQRCRFATKNKQLVTSGADGLLKVWDVKESECVATLDNHSNRIWALDVQDDGMHMTSADADGTVSFWTDNTSELLAQRAQEETLKVEQEQLLKNYISTADWRNAFLLALTLNHPMRLYNVVRAAIASKEDELPVGLKGLEDVMRTLSDEQMAALLRRVRDWNVNFKQFEIAQKVLAVVVDDINMATPEVRKMVEVIIPYNERHHQRLEDLIEETFVLDYAVQEMESIEGI